MVQRGVRVDSPKKTYFSAAEDELGKPQEAQVPGAFPDELLPSCEFSWLSEPLNMKLNAVLRIVRYFPSWLPDGGSRSYGERVQKCTMDKIMAPMQYAMEKIEVRSVCE